MTTSETPPPKELDASVLDAALLEAERVDAESVNQPAQAVSYARADELVDRHYAAVYRYAYRLCDCPVSAEDLVQETFVQAISHLHQLRSSEAERGWLLAIARRQFIRLLRKVVHSKHGRTVSIETPGVDVESALCESQPAANVALDDQDCIQQALKQLGHDARLIVVMHYFEELSYAEIAAQLNIPIGTVMSRLSRSRDQLRRALEEQPRTAASRSTVSTLAQPHLACNATQEARHG